jgi:Fe-S cluster biosynthesis and repair protein YggX
MSNPDARIAQFEKMAADDPDNDMAHFSLGNAYLQADRHADAARSLQRCIELNDQMSKAYQLAGQALIAAGRQDEAASTLDRGYEVAAGKGDMMPRNEIADLLRGIGREPPQISAPTADAAAELGDTSGFVCRRTGRPGTQLVEPPMRGAIGEWIQQNICSETWREWIGQGTKVINEMRLDFSREEDQFTFDEQMCEYLGIDPALYAELTGSPARKA